MTNLGALIVSHSEETADYVAEVLSKAGYVPAYGLVGGADELSSAMDEENWDIVIAEYAPDGAGWFEALKAVKASERKIPFIVLASESDFENPAHAAMSELECIRAGADDFVAEHNERLVSAIVRSMRESRERRELALTRDKLARTELQYRSMVENAVKGFFRMTPWGALVAANPALARTLGHNSPDILLDAMKKRPRENFLAPEDVEKFLFLVEKMDGVEDYEARIERDDGEEIWVSLSAGAVRGESGEFSSIEGTLEDITERKRVESMIVRAKKEWESTFDSVDDIIVVLDAEMRIRRLNWAMAHRLGMHPREAAGLPVDDFVNNDTHDLRDRIRSMMDSGERSVEMSLPALGGDFLVTASRFVGPMENDEGSIVVVAHDVSERKTLETKLRRSQKMEAMGTLAGGIAHDFNNILGVMMGYAEMCLERTGNEGANAQRLGEIIKAGRRASDLIRQILTFSRQEETELRPLDLGPAAKEIAKMLKASLPANIAFELRIADKLEPVMANLTQMHQVIMNLVGNAAQSMPESGGTITLSLSVADGEAEGPEAGELIAGRSMILLQVSDTGSGIDPDILDNIFDPFFTTKKPGSGTGMGLSLVHGIVSSHGGAVTVDSAPGKGSTFNIYLPTATGREYAQPEPQPSMPRVKGRALFVDDEAGLAEVGRDMLESMGFTAVSQTDPLKALEIFKESPESFDLVVTDQTMPGMTGADLAMSILELRPGLPVIMCTGYSETMTRERARELGIRGYLFKPVLKKDLAEAVLAALPEKLSDAG